MNNENNETTIRLPDLCAACLRAFKPILLFVLILSILGGLYGVRGSLGKKAAADPAEIKSAEAALADAQKTQAEAQSALDRVLQVEIPGAEADIARLAALVQGWREYISTSIWNQLDPFHMGVSRLTLVIESEEQIPEDEEEIPAKMLDPATLAYTQVFPVDTELLEEIRQILQADVELTYINELVRVTAVSERLVEICVCYQDPELAKQATDYLVDRLRTRLAQREEGVSVYVAGAYVGYEVNTYLADSQNGYRSKYNAALTELHKAEQALQTIQETNKANAEQTLSAAKAASAKAESRLKQLQAQAGSSAAGLSGLLKKAIRSGLLFFAVGLFLSCVIVFLHMVFSGKLQNVNNALSRYAFPVLGILPKEKRRWFEKTIRRLEGEPDQDYETAGRAAAQSLLSVIGQRKAALVSSEGKDLIRDIVPFVGDKIPVCGDMLKDADAVKAAEQYEGFVLVEAKGQSRLDQIDAEVRRIQALGKEVEGIVLL